jgi:acetyl-CoA carboxylase biotin carboxyl carrier protein
MELAELRQIIAWAEAAGLRSLEISAPGRSLRLSLGSTEPAALAVTGREDTGGPAEAAATVIAAHVTGTFLAAHPMRSAPFVRPGDAVRAGDVLGLLKIGQIYAPVTAPQDGIVLRVLVETGTLADYGMPLLEIRLRDA